MLKVDIDDIFVTPSPTLFFVKKKVDSDVVGRHLLTTFPFSIMIFLLQVFEMSAEKFLSIASTVFLGQNRSLSQSLECKLFLYFMFSLTSE